MEIQDSKKPSLAFNAIRYATIIGVVAFISFLFPNHTSFNYNYEVARTWQYDDLIAQFDFPILKLQEKYLEEQESLADKEAVVFSYNKANLDLIAKHVRSALELHLDSNVTLSEETKSMLDTEIKRAYQTPIIDGKSTKKYISRSLRIIKKNTSITANYRDLVTNDKLSTSLLNKLDIGNVNDKKGLINKLTEAFTANYSFDKVLNEKFRNEVMQQVPATLGLVKKGAVLINNGEIITDKTYRVLNSYKTALSDNSLDKNKYYVFGGYFLLTFLLMLALVMYIRKYFIEVFNDFQSLLFIMIWPVIFSYLVYVIEEKSALNTYMIPFAIAPIIIKNFFNERLALFVHIVVVLIASFLSHLGYEFTFLQIMVGIITILYVSETRHWNKFYLAIVLIFLAYGLGFFGLSLINEGGLSTIPWGHYIWFFINALLVMLAYPFIPLLEKLFGFVSSITLVELSDLNQPLLKELLTKAPGTFQHSLQVGNLAEAAADKIGANSLLIKVGALYHDIGKMKNPEYFIENQKGESPHNSISYFESAEKIIGHVIDGEKLALKAKLPKVIIDFINTHHGTTRTEYFYRKQLEDFPDKEFDVSVFEYPGPNPVSKEQTILMIADSTEAACKSLKSPTGQDIDKLVDGIIQSKMKSNQFDDSELSFKELEEVTITLKSMLRSINHVRIEYPKAES